MNHPISDAWFIRIKLATRELIKVNRGIVAAGEIAHASKSEVSRWQSPTDPDIIPLTAVLALEAECGVCLVTSVMAELNGQRIGTPEGGCLHTAIAGQQAEALRLAAAMMTEGAAALADGKVTPAEAAMIDRAASDLQRAIEPLRRNLAAVQAALLARRG